MPVPADIPAPLQQARRFVDCAANALVIARAFHGHDQLRESRALDDVEANLAAASDRVRAQRAAIIRPLVNGAAGLVLTLAAFGALFIPGLPS